MKWLIPVTLIGCGTALLIVAGGVTENGAHGMFVAAAVVGFLCWALGE